MTARRPSPRILALACALAALAPALASAQQRRARPMTELEKEQEHASLFADGLRAITARELDAAQQAFERCVALFPERAVSYYNLACVHALRGDAPRAVAQLRASFERGFLDVAHMQRDPDLDAIRRTPELRKAISEFEAQILRTSPEPLVHVPQDAAGPALVYMHGQRARAADAFDALRQALPGWRIVVVRGVEYPGERGYYYWDSRAEFLVLHATRTHLADVDPGQVYLAGDHDGGGAFAVGVAAHHPELFAGVLAAGGALDQGTSDVELSGLRAYLVVHARSEAQEASAMAARDAFAAADSPVVLERYPAEPQLTRDGALLLRGLNWLRGEALSLPGAGQVREF